MADFRQGRNEPQANILNYARFHGLSKDYLSSPTTGVDWTKHISPNWMDELSSEDDDLQYILPVKVPLTERLQLDKDAVLYLQSIILPENLVEDEAIYEPELTWKACDFKQELPLLATDNELDMQWFWRERRPDLRRISAASADMRREIAEMIKFPDEYLEAYLQCDLKAKQEKLQVSRDSLLYLWSVVSHDSTLEEELEFDTGFELERKQALRPLTPPLLPLSPPRDSFVLASPAAYVPILSDDSNLTAIEAEELEQKILADDAIVPSQVERSFLHEITATDDDDHRSTPALDNYQPDETEGIKLVDLKVEGPLTPPSILSQGNEQFEVRNGAWNFLTRDALKIPPTLIDVKEADRSDDSVQAFFDQVIAPVAAKVNQRVEQEQLQEADSTKRVPVPVVDFTLPHPPWKMHSQKPHGKHREGETELESQCRLIKELKRGMRKNLQLWPGLTELELKLRWSPFSADIGKPAIEETIEDHAALENFCGESLYENETDTQYSTWKPDGLRIFDSDEDSEDELEEGHFEDGRGLDFLLTKRKLQLEEEGNHTNGESSTDNVGITSNLESQTQNNNAPDATAAPGGQSMILGSVFSASESLSRFMNLHGHKPKKQRTGEVGQSTAPPLGSVLTSKHAQSHSNGVVDTSQVIQLSAIKVPMPRPVVALKLPPRSFIIASTVWAQRKLMRQIEQLYPNAEFIERDFTHHNNFGLDFEEDSKRRNSTEEADIIVSPRTGLIWTTLQKMKQLALPGQVPKSAIRERLSILANRYEQLIVLISEGKSNVFHGGTEESIEEHAKLDENDCHALAEMMAFVNNLDSEVLVQYVPGTDLDLAVWIVGAMTRYGLPEGNHIRLLQDETMWELFLRRAGLNAFAAQAVLGELKSPETEEKTPSDMMPQTSCLESASKANAVCYGLAMFVKMSVKERLDRFEVLVGRRVLQRVSRTLDVRWISASGGGPN